MGGLTAWQWCGNLLDGDLRNFLATRQES